MSKRPQKWEGDRTEIALAKARAAGLERKGWARVHPGDLAALRASGEYERFELASWPTAIVYHEKKYADDEGPGAFKAIGFEVWRRPWPGDVVTRRADLVRAIAAENAGAKS